MPRYYFDLIDVTGLFVDSEGTVLSGPKQAEMEAVRTLVEIARDYAVGHRMMAFRLVIRDETGAEVAVTSLDIGISRSQ